MTQSQIQAVSIRFIYVPYWQSLLQQGRVYRDVIEDVINSVRETFTEEGFDEHILQEIKQSWERRLAESKVLDPPQSTDAVGSGSGGAAASNSSSNNLSSGSSNNRGRKGPDPPLPGGQPRNWPPHAGGLVAQVDGPNDSSDEDDDEDIDNDDDRDENDDEDKEEENEAEDDQVLLFL